MELEIKISKSMDEKNEHSTIRMPMVCRDKYCFKTGRFLHLRNKNGGIEALQVLEAFKNDIATEINCAYVTTKVYKRLFMIRNGTSEVIRVHGITLGCDPESFLVDTTNGNLIAAHRFMKKYGDVGHDGMLLEFRPNPSTDAKEVCNNLWSLIQKGRSMLDAHPEGNKIAIVGASSWRGLTAGFHLHFGLPRGLLGRRPDTNIVARLMTTAFDYYVGVPSIIPEGNKDFARRTIKFVDYGKPGGYRLDSRTFEFRLPGGINLTHPLLATGLLALGAVVAGDVASRINTCTDSFTNLKEMTSEGDLRSLYPGLPEIQDSYSIICNPDIGAALNHFETIKNDVRSMIGYEHMAEDVEAYFTHLDSGTEFGNNILQNWRDFYNEKQQEKMVVL